MGKPGVGVPIWVVHVKGGKMGRCGLNREEGMGFGPQGLQMSLKGQVVVVWSWSVVSDSASPGIAAHQAPTLQSLLELAQFHVHPVR